MALTRPLLAGRLNANSNDAPHLACRPFAADRAGGVIGEGGGLVILEALDHARARGARIYAELVGFGAGNSPHPWSKPEMTGRAAALTLRKAMADARINPDQVQLAVPFGTGMTDVDATEMAGWNSVFADRLNRMSAFTTRGALGYNGAGTGAMDFAAAVLAVHRNTVPHSLNTERPDPACAFRFVQRDPVDMNITHAVSLSYALAGGQHAALVVRKYQE